MLAIDSTFRPFWTTGTFAVMATLLLNGGCAGPKTLPRLPPPTVITAKATQVDQARALRLSGTIEAERSVNASFAVPGTIQEVLVREGDSVRRGQVLARMVSRSYEDALGIAKAKSEQAEDAYRRLEPMFRNHTVPEVKMVEIETGRTQARLSLSMAQKSLDDTVLRAPEAGVVARKVMEAGSNAAPGAPVITLVHNQTVLATAAVPEKAVARCKKGDKAKVVVAALGKTFEGNLREIGVVADPLTRSYTIKVALANSEGDLRVGMVSEIYVDVPGGSRALVVPPAAIRIDEAGKPCVFVALADQTVRRRNVNVVGYVGEGAAISEGLKEGEEVVVSGTPMLSDGMVVRR